MRIQVKKRKHQLEDEKEMPKFGSRKLNPSIVNQCSRSYSNFGYLQDWYFSLNNLYQELPVYK